MLGVLAPTRAELNAFFGEAEAGLSAPEVSGARRYCLNEVEAIGFVTGQGSSRCAAALERALDSRLFSAFLMVGVAGGTQPDQVPGDLLVASGAGPLYAQPTPANPRLVEALAGGLRAADLAASGGPLAATDRLARYDEKRRLGESGFIGVDMETQVLLAGARRAGIPAAALRVVLDPLGRDIPHSVAALAAAQGGRLWPDILGLARWPLEIRAITHFMRDMGTALETLRAVAGVTVSALDEAG